jgi:hypothetical protein
VDVIAHSPVNVYGCFGVTCLPILRIDKQENNHERGWTLKIEAAYSSKISANIYQTVRRYFVRLHEIIKTILT